MPVRNFDEARKQRIAADRSFVIGGETLTYRASVAPEQLVAWTTFASSTDRETAAVNAAKAQLRAEEARALAPETKKLLAEDADANADHEAELARLALLVAEREEALAAVEKPESEWLDLIDETITACLEPASVEMWPKVRDPNLPDPLNVADLSELMQWLLTQVTSRPTGPPSSSTPSRRRSGTSSTVDSSLPAAAASAA